MYDTVHHILSKIENRQHRYLVSGDVEKKAVIVITSNRGLAGGYNSNVVKLITRHESWKKEDLLIFSIGNKGREALQRYGYQIRQDLSHMVEEPIFADAMKLSESVLALFEEGKIGEIYLAYTSFRNTVSHDPTLLRLLPVDYDVEHVSETDNVLMNFEPTDEEALDMIIPKYITSLIYGALKESIASENGARMQAMDNATSNAEEMIGDLTLKYNRARQGSITQELTEIIAGAEAIS